MPAFEGDKVTALIQVSNVILHEDSIGKITLEPGLRNALDCAKIGCEEMLNKTLDRAKSALELAQDRIKKAQTLDLQLNMFGANGKPTTPVDANGKALDGTRHSQLAGAISAPGPDEPPIPEVTEWELEERRKLEAEAKMKSLVQAALAAGQTKTNAVQSVATQLGVVQQVVLDSFNTWLAAGLIAKQGRGYIWVSEVQEAPQEVQETAQAGILSRFVALEVELKTCVEAYGNDPSKDRHWITLEVLDRCSASNPALTITEVDQQWDAAVSEGIITGSVGKYKWIDQAAPAVVLAPQFQTKAQVPEDVKRALCEAIEDGSNQVQAVTRTHKITGVSKPMVDSYFEQLVREGHVAKGTAGKLYVATPPAPPVHATA